jgi:hypothetical protein
VRWLSVLACDGDCDIKDCGDFYSCFSGLPGTPAFVEPSLECQARFDFDGDGAVGRDDFKELQAVLSGP